MTSFKKYGLLVFVLTLTIFILNPIPAGAQEPNKSNYKLTLAEAVQLAKSQNKWVQAAGIQEDEALEERKMHSMLRYLRLTLAARTSASPTYPFFRKVLLTPQRYPLRQLPTLPMWGSMHLSISVTVEGSGLCKRTLIARK